jgi:hypothetical protein
LNPAEIGLSVLNKDKVDAEKNASSSIYLTCHCLFANMQPLMLCPEPEPPRYFQFESEKGGLDYRITSLGHPISLKTEYPKSCLSRYEIKLRKGRDMVMKSTYRISVTLKDLISGVKVEC